MKKGFTLIELLIVIAILGILAIGLIAALDPLEQLRRARDTATRNTVEDFYNAALRYYSIQEEFPWGSVGVTATSLTDATDYISSLIAAGELKSRFADNTKQLAKVYLTSTTESAVTGDIEDIRVCFRPESKAIQDDDNNKYDVTGLTADPAECPSIGGSCYWCID